MYSLYKTDGSAGDSGPLSMLMWEEHDEVKYQHSARPRVGCCIRVGSISARSFSQQDWWQTSLITEITDEWRDDNKDCVRFKTQNSTYIWKSSL